MGDAEFCYAAYKAAKGPLRPYEDGDTIVMIRVDPRDPSHKVSDDFDTQVRYWQIRFKGESHAMAEMLATRSFPGLKGTDSVFMEGRKLGGQQFEGLPRYMGEQYVSQALAAGVNPAGKYYSGTLARFPGDPRAWITGLGDARRIAAERGIGLTGAVTVDAPRYADGYVPPDTYKVDERIVNEHVAPGATGEVRAAAAGRLSGYRGGGSS